MELYFINSSWSLSWSENSPNFEISWEVVMGPHLVRNETIPHPYPISLRIIVLLSSSLLLFLRCGLLPSDFPTKILYAFVKCCMFRPYRPTKIRRQKLWWIIQIMRFLFMHFLCPHIHLSILFSEIFSSVKSPSVFCDLRLVVRWKSSWLSEDYTTFYPTLHNRRCANLKSYIIRNLCSSVMVRAQALADTQLRQDMRQKTQSCFIHDSDSSPHTEVARVCVLSHLL
jgi:hypothetical protein